MTNRFPRRRDRLRYPGYDYAQPGTVFVTICCRWRQPLFGTVDDGHVFLTPAGAMVAASWQRIPDKYGEIRLDAFVVMPDHLHGVLVAGSDPDGTGQPASVGDAVRWFKTVTVRAYRDGIRAEGWERYDQHLWQDKFHDRIIRSDAELAAVRAYIAANPARWWERQQADAATPMGFRHGAWETNRP
jgi:putative transposase